MVPINYLAVLIAAVAAMALGALWYGPLFGKKWMALEGIDPNMTPEMKKGVWKLYALNFVGTLVMSFVLAHSVVFGGAYLDLTGASAGLQAGFWNWLGFIATVSLGSVLWQRKPWKLYFLNIAYYLVALLVMGTILAVWR
jgi:hypothetical protein